MTTDAAWLRTRPEIVKTVKDGYASYGTVQGEWTISDIIIRALPLLRAAIREDVVRELAGADVYHPDPDAVRMLAAAHVQGYERAREEIVSWVSDADPALADRIKERFKP